MKAWYLKFIEQQKLRAKRKKERAELEQCNWGIDHGWYVEYQGEVVGELINGQFQDMFWYSYELIAYEKHKYLVLTMDHWLQNQFQLKNKYYPQYVHHWIIGGEDFEPTMLKPIISIRGLQLSGISN